MSFIHLIDFILLIGVLFASEMAENLTGYGPSSTGRYNRLLFDGDERKYEQWEVKFLGYMRLRKLKDVITAKEDEAVDGDKNAEAYAELIQFLDDTSLALIMREAADDGRKALKILRQHYASSGKPRIISLYTELTSLIKAANETVTDYIIRAETACAALNNAGEKVSDSLLIAMVLKGLPETFKPFVTVVTQNEKKQSFTDFKAGLRSFEETERSRGVVDDAIMKVNTTRACYRCGQTGHFYSTCDNKPKGKWCTICQNSSHNDSNCRRQGQRKGKSVKDNVNKLTEEFEEENHSFTFKSGDYRPGEDSLQPDMLLVDCGATTHILNNDSLFVKFDDSFVPSKHFIELADGTRANNIAQKRGDAQLLLKDDRGRQREVTLKNALYVPSYPQNIFSVQAATAKGANVSFSPNSSELIDRDGTKFDIVKHGRLYYLDFSVFNDPESDKLDCVNHVRDLKDWHEILGHCNVNDVLKLQAVVDGMKIAEKKDTFDCNVCTMGKMTQSRSRKPDCKSGITLEFVHTDLAGPIEPASKEGFRYAISFTDDCSGVVFVYFLKSKNGAAAALEQFLADSAPYGDVKRLRSDNGSEFTAAEFKNILIKNKIKHETSAPYSPHQNGTAERNWRTLFEMGRCLLLQANLSKVLWPYAVMTAAYIRNRCYNENLKQTPFFILTGKKPNLSNMQLFGTECYVYKQERRKLDPKSSKGIFVGYDKGSPAYLVYFPETDKVTKHRIVKFVKKSVNEQQTQTESGLEGDDMIVVPKFNVDLNNERVPNEGAIQNDNGGVENESETEQTVTVPEGNSQRYPSRKRNPPAYLQDYVADGDKPDQVLSCLDYCYRVSAMPQSYEEAMASEDATFWKKAMEEEMSSLKENDTFTVVKLPEDRHPVGERWVYTIKEGVNGGKCHKARYVAKGYSQVKGIDFEETFAPTANLLSIRMLIQLAVEYDWNLHQMDVKTAYLNAPIDHEIFVEQPEGFQVTSDEGTLVYKLNKSLYGLKQSGRMWNSLLHEYLIKNNFEQNPVDQCIYMMHSHDEIAVILVWVDDLLIAASNDELLNNVKQMLKNQFKMKDLGKLSYFLGMEFEQNDGVIKMHQRKYLCKILERFEMSECKPKYTPSEQKLVVTNEPLVNSRYREAVGSLIYAMTCTRPDISWVVTKLSQHLSNTQKEHWVAVKHVLRYLKGTLDYELSYKKSGGSLTLTGFRGKIIVKYCPIENMLADIMTKPATKAKLEQFKHVLFD